MRNLTLIEHRTILKALDTLFSFKGEDVFRKATAATKQVIDAEWAATGILTGKQREIYIVGETDPLGVTSVQDDELLFLLMNKHPLWTEGIDKQITMPRKISDQLTIRQFRETAIYVEFYSRYRVDDQITMGMPIPGNRELALTLSRSRMTFTDRDRELFFVLRPYVLAALSHVYALERIQVRLNLLDHMLEAENKPLIHFTQGFSNLTISEASRRLLQKYFPGWNALTSLLPKDLMQWIEHEENRMKATDDVYLPPQPLVVKAEFSSLAIRVVRDTQSDQRILILEELLEHYTPEMIQTLGLTQREAEMLIWVIEGKTNAEIASICGISPRTVQKHLEHIFQKLGVETRTAAARTALEAIGTNSLGFHPFASMI